MMDPVLNRGFERNGFDRCDRAAMSDGTFLILICDEASLRLAGRGPGYR